MIEEATGKFTTLDITGKAIMLRQHIQGAKLTMCNFHGNKRRAQGQEN
uniref:Uncharacterized protein n=1 Tax=Arundo donax TaxID=35708 RepID=A0A0A9ANM4_ARUDO